MGKQFTKEEVEAIQAAEYKKLNIALGKRGLLYQQGISKLIDKLYQLTFGEKNA